MDSFIQVTLTPRHGLHAMWVGDIGLFAIFTNQPLVLRPTKSGALMAPRPIFSRGGIMPEHLVTLRPRDVLMRYSDLQQRTQDHVLTWHIIGFFPGSNWIEIEPVEVEISTLPSILMAVMQIQQLHTETASENLGSR